MKASTNLFSFKNNVFVTEISTLEANSSNGQAFHRVFGCSGNFGLELISAKTGKSVRYFITTTVRDNEGDIQSWRLSPISDDVRGNQKAAASSITIFNT